MLSGRLFQSRGLADENIPIANSYVAAPSGLEWERRRISPPRFLAERRRSD